jgi:hypothetical protein
VNIDDAPIAALDDTIRSALFAVAGDLQIAMASVPAWTSAAGEVGVRESDLQRAVCRALQAQLGSVVSVEGPLPTGVKDHWSGRLGRIDVVARPAGSTDIYFETKLCGVDKLYEVIWDLLKLALLTALPEAAAGYLVYAAPEAGWTRRRIVRLRSSRATCSTLRSCFAITTRTLGDGASAGPRPLGRPGYLPMSGLSALGARP